MGWYEATNAHFHRDYYKRRKLGGLLGTTTKLVRSILSFSKYFTGRLGRSESFEKSSLKVPTLKKISAALRAAKLIHIFSAALRAVQHGLYTSNLLPTPMVMMGFVS